MSDLRVALRPLLWNPGFTAVAVLTLALALVRLALLVVAVMACWLPARRAARVDPLVALRGG